MDRLGGGGGEGGVWLSSFCSEVIPAQVSYQGEFHLSLILSQLAAKYSLKKYIQIALPSTVKFAII